MIKIPCEAPPFIHEKNMLETIKDQIPNIHKEGYLLILGFVVVTAILFGFSSTFGWMGVIMTLWCVYFFRDPERVTPLEDNVVISPADGLVQSITQTLPPAELDMEPVTMTRVSIFLNVFDVHVNRVPVDGVVIKSHYHHGKFFNASLDKASEHNERQSVLVETPNGMHIAFVQIAGLIARRIICDLEEGEMVTAGKRFGIIKFGSRMDVYLPEGITPQVLVGQKAVGGETVIAKLSTPKKTKN